jgi:hypothetical protein
MMTQDAKPPVPGAERKSKIPHGDRNDKLMRLFDIENGGRELAMLLLSRLGGNLVSGAELRRLASPR